ncbi:MAG: ABC transporter permease [Lachnospiraceae bacterium]|nr:ABC transporter permease [Lachnospiraceae bacterium]
MSLQYFIKKFITLIITLLLITLLTFTAFTVIPGDAAMSKLGTDATEEQVEALREEMGLNDPLPARYFNWLASALRGDFGESYQYSGVTVAELLAARLPVTLLLAVMSLILILVISFPLGILSAMHAGKWIDTLINQLSQITMAVPAFFLGMMMTWVFGLILKWFQPGAFIDPSEDFMGCVRYMIFPAIAVALPKIAMVVKFLRNSILNELNQDYVRTARSKGARALRVLYGHVLKNALIPVITFLAMVIAEILAGSIVVEQVFGLPGMGRLLITSISARDYPVVQAIVTYITTVVVVINFIVDILYQFVDPRVKTTS